MREGFDGGSSSGERRSVPAAQRKRFFGKFLRIIFLEMNSVPAALREQLWVEVNFFGEFFWNEFRSRSAAGTVCGGDFFCKLIPFPQRGGNGCVAQHEFLIWELSWCAE
jgi:hypothetical protein